MFDSNSNAKSDSIITNQFSQVEYYNRSPNNSYLNFPSHLLDDDALFLGAVLPYPLPPPPPPPPPPQPVMDEKSGDQRAAEKGKRKRPSGGSGGLSKGSGGGGGGGGGRGRPKRWAGKKDRHSKISTAHGPRDRRMRLSLQIARKFFDLQDMLGFDKASKTIEWLFNKSKAAVKDVAERSCTGIMPPSPPPEVANEGGRAGGGGGDCDKKNKKKEKGISVKEVKENRERARARARERTKEKLIMKHKGKLVIEQNPNSTSNMEQNQPLEEQMASVAIIDKFLGYSNDSSSCIFEFHHREGQDRVVDDPNRVVSCDPRVVGLLDFAGNWETEDGRISSGHGGVVVSSDDVQVQGPNFGFNHIN